MRRWDIPPGVEVVGTQQQQQQLRDREPVSVSSGTEWCIGRRPEKQQQADEVDVYAVLD
jgi:hypothetical protein